MHKSRAFLTPSLQSVTIQQMELEGGGHMYLEFSKLYNNSENNFPGQQLIQFRRQWHPIKLKYEYKIDIL